MLRTSPSVLDRNAPYPVVANNTHSEKAMTIEVCVTIAHRCLVGFFNVLCTMKDEWWHTKAKLIAPTPPAKDGRNTA